MLPVIMSGSVVAILESSTVACECSFLFVLSGMVSTPIVATLEKENN